MEFSGKILKCEKIKGTATLKCEINLDKLLPTPEEKTNFESNYSKFISSDPANKHVYRRNNNYLSYSSEEIIPVITSDRPNILFVVGNPASHSILEGMFFSYQKTRNINIKKDHRFWAIILKESNIVDLSLGDSIPINIKNSTRCKILTERKYKSFFSISLTVFISMPSSASGSWSGVQGIKNLIGSNDAYKMIENDEKNRILETIKSYGNNELSVITFLGDAWNLLKSDNDPNYSQQKAIDGKLIGTINRSGNIAICGSPKTMLAAKSAKTIKSFLTKKYSYAKNDYCHE